MSAAFFIGFVWIAIGFGMTLTSGSRGWFADGLFILTWPVHVVMYLLGKE